MNTNSFQHCKSLASALEKFGLTNASVYKSLTVDISQQEEDEIPDVDPRIEEMILSDTCVLQRTLISNRGSFSRTSKRSHRSAQSRGSSNAAESGDYRDEEDDIRDLTT